MVTPIAAATNSASVRAWGAGSGGTPSTNIAATPKTALPANRVAVRISGFSSGRSREIRTTSTLLIAQLRPAASPAHSAGFERNGKPRRSDQSISA